MNLENVEEFYPLTPMQQGLLFHSLYEPGTGVYCDQVSYSLKGDLDVSAFRRAWQWVVDRHAVLRTAFVWENLKEPIQVVYQKVSLPFEEEDWRRIPPMERDQRLAAYLRTTREHGFQLSKPPLMRMGLIQLENESYHFVGNWHHLLLDGWSFSLVHREVFAVYEAFRREQDPKLEPSRPFKDYIKWLRGQDLSQAKNFWVNRLKGFTAPTVLSLNRIPGTTSEGASGYGDQKNALSAASTAALKAFARRFHLTLNTLVQGAWALLLARYGGEDDVVFGATVSGRPAALAGVESMVGVFINTLPVRVPVPAHDTLVPWLQRLQGELVEMRQYEYTPLVKVQEWSEVPHNLFDSLLVFENFPTDTSGSLQHESLEVSKRRYVTRINYPLTALVEPEPEISIRLMYERSHFQDSAIERMSGHLRTILERMIVDPNQRLADIPLLPESERHQLLSAWNATSVDYPREKTLPQLFEDQAARTPEQVAVRFEQEALTYAELNRRANQLAQYLHTLGVGPGTAVGICLERSLDMVVALLGILKAGGAYVPLDPAFPRDRLAFMVADAGLSLIVTKEDLKDAVPGTEGSAVCLDTAWGQISQQPAEPPGQLATSDDIAYVIYTSGSTGKPKGVEVPHRALTNFLWAMRTAPGCTAQDVLLAVTTLSFDIAALELYLPLIVGGRIELVSREVAADGRRLRERLERCCPTLMQATPATWRMLLDAGWQGTPGLTALCGGEALPRDLATELLERTAALWNMYGPTETTIWSSADRISPDAPEITIGRPIANTEFYILDKHRQPVPVGVPGELFIGGDGLARGYRHRPELTADRFIPHPFSTVPGARVYRTGDLARYRADGRVVHLGRLDHQVKVRGFRIELGEIEAALAAHEGVGQAVVTVRDDRPGDRSLVAYLVPAPGRAVVPVELRQHLRRTLPEYMVPQFFVELEAFPLTPNGKVDRRQLPAPERGLPYEAAAVVAPRTPTEERVAQIWAEVLKVPQVGAHHDFFELGGHSLLAIQVLSQIAHTFKVELPLRVLFTAPTVAQLAEEVDSAIGSLRRSPHGALADTSERRGPRTRTEHRLLAIWERLLDAGPIGVRDSFFDLQGDADLFDKMLAETRSAFGAFAEGLPVSTIRKEPTIETLARIIDDSIPPVSSLVVSLQPHGSGRPLFLIHAAGGYVFFYRALAAHLGPHRLVYGVRAETRTDGRGQSFDRSQSVEELAARYIAEIKTLQSDGPYSLGGACFGGVVAFEMARQLRLRGEEVGPVLLFDSFVLNNGNCREEDGLPTWTNRGVVPLRQRITTHLKRVSQLNLGRAVWYVSQKVARKLVSEVRLAIRALWRKLPSGVSDLLDDLICFAWRMRGKPDSLERTQLRMMARFLERAAQLLRKYVPSVHEGSLVLFKAGQGHDPTPLWRDLARGGMGVHEMVGVHLDMLEEPTVAETAALVRQYLLKDGTSVVPRIGT